MASTLLEQLRQNQQDIEYLEKAILIALFLKSENPHNIILSDHIIKHFLDQIQSKSVQCLKIHQDDDKLKREEIEFLKGNRRSEDSTANKSLDVWINYYDELARTIDYHNKFTQYGAPAEIQDENWFFKHSLDDRSQLPQFSGQEGFGRYVDMHELYLTFINLKLLRKHKLQLVSMDYVSYLASFDAFHEVPIKCKDKSYINYLEDLKAYLEGFFIRTQPLLSVERLREHQERDFQSRWYQRNIRGWEQLPTDNELSNDPLYCVPCKHLFSNKNVFKAHRAGNRHKRAVENIAETIEQPHDLDKFKNIAFLECYISRLKEALGDTIDDTINNIRKKQTRTAEELTNNLNDSDQEEPFKLPIEILKQKADKKQMGESSSSEEEERPYYNPKNLPIGFDGKPIPYWLYKYHGLNKEYKCEICGNYSYWGRRAFERHFSEWRHAYGMRCLRIPNTMHFREITQIDEAIQLHRKLMEDHSSELFNPDFEEEIEDRQGNVMIRKNYDELKRQGLEKQPIKLCISLLSPQLIFVVVLRQQCCDFQPI